MKKIYSISIVNYLNTLPFQYGLQHSEIKNRIDLQLDIPSVCAQKLKNNEVDIGLVPVALIPELKEYHIIGDYCIGAVGKVDSVKLYSFVSLHEITRILLDYQSKTSVSLVQVLAKHFWKIEPEFIAASVNFENEIKDKTAAVIIGDRTFSRNGQYPYEYDLAEEWQKFKGLPFVFAAWISKRNIKDEDFLKTFNTSLANGVNNIDAALKSYQNTVKQFDPIDYLKNKISYEFTEDKKLALNVFLRYLSP